METVAPTRTGTAPNRAGREGVTAAMDRLLDEGHDLIHADPSAEQLRSWAARLGELARGLADCVEAPVRNRVMETLESVSVPDDANALTVLRINVTGASVRQLGLEVDVAAGTIDRAEAGEGCHVHTAKQIADRYALNVTELFDMDLDNGGGKLLVRDVASLRDAMASPDHTFARAASA